MERCSRGLRANCSCPSPCGGVGRNWEQTRAMPMRPTGALSQGQNREPRSASPMRAERAFAHPHMGHGCQAPLIGWVWGAGVGGAAARGAMRSAARRRGGRSAQGLASGNSCCSQHHLISGRTGLVRTHIPHACGEEATGMGPIYEGGLFVLARGWHGHHPSRADRGRCRGAGRVG
jgi:hypothetical protein